MRVAKAILIIEAVAFTTGVTAFFIASLASGLPNRTPWEFTSEMAVLAAVFALIWTLGFCAVKCEGVMAWGSFALRLATLGVMFFTQPGLMVSMVILLPSTMLLLIGVPTRRYQSGP